MPAARPQPVAHGENHALAASLAAMLAASGSAGHPMVRRLTADNTHVLSRETLADTLHQLSLLHGPRPSVFETAILSPLVPVPGWLGAATRAFAGERDMLARLMVAAGPPPRRSDQTRAEEAVNANRNALLTLAGSDRLGCAIGAAVALALDWKAVSDVLRCAAVRLDVPPPERQSAWPTDAETLEAAEVAAALPGGLRAVTFGFQTLLAQHRAFWDIVHSRTA